MTTFRTANGRIGTRNGKVLRIGAGGAGCCPECDQPVLVCQNVSCPDCPAQYTLSVSGAQLHTFTITVGFGEFAGTWLFEIPSSMEATMNCVVVPVVRGGFDPPDIYVNNNNDPPISFTGGVSQPDNNFQGVAQLHCGIMPAPDPRAFWRCDVRLETLFFNIPSLIGLHLTAIKPVLPGETCPGRGTYTVISSSIYGNSDGIPPDPSTLIVPETMTIT